MKTVTVLFRISLCFMTMSAVVSTRSSTVDQLIDCVSDTLAAERSVCIKRNDAKSGQYACELSGSPQFSQASLRKYRPTQGEVTSQNLWLRYDRHFVGTTRTTWCVELNGEDLSCCSNKTESVSLRKCPYDHWLINRAYLSAIAATNISQRDFTYKMAAKINWHRYGTKLRHCHPVYCCGAVRQILSEFRRDENCAVRARCSEDLCAVRTHCAPVATRQ